MSRVDVGIVMGSDSDLPDGEGCRGSQQLRSLLEMSVISAHRTPHKAAGMQKAQMSEG